MFVYKLCPHNVVTHTLMCGWWHTYSHTMNFDLKTSILSGANWHSSNTALHTYKTHKQRREDTRKTICGKVHSETRCQINEDTLDLRSSCRKGLGYARCVCYKHSARIALLQQSLLDWPCVLWWSGFQRARTSTHHYKVTQVEAQTGYRPYCVPCGVPTHTHPRWGTLYNRHLNS